MLFVPTEGVKTFELYRYAYDLDTVQIFIGEDQYEVSDDELRLWLRHVGVDFRMIDKLVDWLWNTRRIQYVLKEQRMLIPEDQANPFEGHDIVDTIMDEALPPMLPHGVTPFWSM